jgi:hypothetical protein
MRLLFVLFFLGANCVLKFAWSSFNIFVLQLQPRERARVSSGEERLVSRRGVKGQSKHVLPKDENVANGQPLIIILRICATRI